MTASPSTLFVVMMDVEPDHEVELNHWYAEEHLAERLSCPGFKSVTRYRGADQPPGGRPQEPGVQPRYLALYEVEDPAVMQSQAYRKLIENPSPWTQRLREHYQVRVRQTYVEIPPGG